MEQGKITKVKLSNDAVYTFFDKGAIRLNSDGVLVTGNGVVDNIILNGHLTITQIDDIPVNDYKYILVSNDIGNIMRRPRKTFLQQDLQASATVDDGKLEIAIHDYEPEPTTPGT